MGYCTVRDACRNKGTCSTGVIKGLYSIFPAYNPKVDAERAFEK